MALNLNECMISGTVFGDPQIVGEGDNAWAFLNIMTSFGGRTADGGFTDVDQPVPIVTDEPRNVKTVQKYIKNGKALAARCYYRTWEANGVKQHGLFVRNFTFAKANYGAEGQGGAPGMPTG